MTRFTLLNVFILCSLTSVGQIREASKLPPAPTRQSDLIERENMKCMHKVSISLSKRLQFYPFNKAAQIRIVSFDNKPDSNGFITPNGALPIKNDSVDYSAMDEIKILNGPQIDTLSGILYNFGFKSQPMTISQSCYNPRNAILFVDNTGKTFEFIELCFQCWGHRESSKDVVTGDFCSEKYDLLKKYFSSLGICIGTGQKNDLLQ